MDALVVVWIIAWVALGLAVAREVDGLKELSGTVRTTGLAVEESGRAIRSLGPLPLVGDRLERPGRRIEDAGRSAASSARSSRRSIERLSVLLGLAIGVIPSVPLVALYLPARLGAGQRGDRAPG